ncbi:hypothetical protein KIL84_001136, partial [Mauremys mutica]
LFAKALANNDIGSLICNVGAGGAPAAAAAPSGVLPLLRRRKTNLRNLRMTWDLVSLTKLNFVPSVVIKKTTL